MSNRRLIPEEVVKEIELKKPKKIPKEIKVIYSKQTNQFSLKIPSKIRLELDLKPTDRFEVSIDNNKNIILKRVS
jgi:AbrB family looped-hinge helix DNA binding protein